jgi:hypothetical protein
VVSSFPLGEII